MYRQSGRGDGPIQPEVEVARAYRAALEALAQDEFEVVVPEADHPALAEIAAGLRRLAQVMREKYEENRRLEQLKERIDQGILVEETLEHVFASFSTIIPYDRIGYARLISGGKVARSVWAKSKAAHVLLPVGYAASLAGSSLEAVVATRQPRIINDLEDYLLAHPQSRSTALIVAEGMRSSLTCPLITESGPVGFLFFSSLRAATYANAHVDVFLRIARQLARVIERAEHYEEVLGMQRMLRETNEQLRNMVAIDALTGIANRRAFDNRLDMEVRRARREGKPLSLLMIDVDHFKAYNDLHGHANGDTCLRQVATALAATLQRPHDFVARYGGEEFAVVLAHTPETGARVVAERLRRAIEALCIAHNRPSGGEVVTVSIGWATTSDEGSDAQTSTSDLIAAADAALYRAKIKRNCCEGTGPA